MRKSIHWQTLSSFESYDFVANWYERAHGRRPNAAKVRQINANFSQAGEYFSNAAQAAMSVKPLLLYYGVLSLGRGIILANDPRSKEETLKPSHGLEPVDWQSILKGHVENILEIPVRATAGTFSQLADVCWNLYTMHKFQGVTNTMGSDGHDLGEITFAADRSLLTLDDLISRLLCTGGMYERITGRKPQVYGGCRIASHPPGTHFAFPIIGIPQDLLALHDGVNVAIGSSNQIAPGFRQSDDDADSLIFVHQGSDEYKAAKERFPVSHYEAGEFMSVILDFPNGDRMTEFFKLYLTSYCLGMLCRYYPSVWLALLQHAKGDFAYPLLVAAVEAIETEFPEYACHQLTGYPKPRR